LYFRRTTGDFNAKVEGCAKFTEAVSNGLLTELNWDDTQDFEFLSLMDTFEFWFDIVTP
jgi:alkyl sulfatase BDS1-like metallo-beta-lactamase superfamily hydrolase